LLRTAEEGERAKVLTRWKKTVLNPEGEIISSPSEGDKSRRTVVKTDLVTKTYGDFQKA